MKQFSALLFCLATLAASPAFAQPAAPAPQVQSRAAERTLTKFDLDFPGGTPGELVSAIQKAMGRPLNVIVPTGFADRQLPALKMSRVDVAQLFHALSATANVPQIQNGMVLQSQSGFRTNDGQPTDDSVWFFYVQEAPHPANPCRFYALTPYLERGLTVDDITTAIQTAWKMQGTEGIPTMSFHKETKLLIVVGDGFRLQTIDQALEALKAPSPKTKPTPTAENPAHAEEKKS